MNITVLGGAGIEGTGIARDLVRSAVSEVILADINVEEARKIAADLATEQTNVSACFVDVNDFEGLVNSIKNTDTVVSALGPFYKYGVKTVKATIEAGVPYVDLNDDYDSTKEALELNDEAKKTGIPVIIGMGVSPGLSNVCAIYGANKLDRVDAISISWIAAAGPGGPAVLLHFFHGISDEIPIYFDKEWKSVSPVREGKKAIAFPDPFGLIEIPYIGHPEAITLPKFIEGVKTVTVRGSVYPLTVQNTFEKIAELGLLARKPVQINEISVTPREFILECFDTLIETPEMHKEVDKVINSLPSPAYGSLIVEVDGKKAGKSTNYQYIVNADLCDITDWPASIVAQMLAKREIKQTGVLCPDQCIKPEPFFSALKNRGIEIEEVEKIIQIL